MVKIIKSALRGERGSALLLSLMVMVGLSLLGLGFVAIAETENAISINQRNTAQTAALAEAGARAVVEWFQKPEWAGPAVDGGVVGIMPAKTPFASDDPFKQDRMVDPDGTGPTGVQNEGEHKDRDSDLFFCCDRPFKPAINDRYYGSEQAPDILIVEDGGGPGTAFLTTFNTILFGGPPADAGRVTEIRIFAPPILDGNLNASNFWDHGVGSRYGLATIRATAEKRTQTGQPFARRSVKIVLSEWPFPGPQGPIQSNANIQTGGNVAVHWGKMTAQGTMFVKRPLMGIPWYNPYEKMHFEHGYDSSNEWQPTRLYLRGDIVHPAGNSDEPWVRTDLNPPALSGVASPFPAPGTSTVGDTVADGLITWTRRIKTKYPNLNSGTYDQGDYLYELLNDGTPDKEFDDPWIEARSRGDIMNGNVQPAMAGVPHPFKYIAASAEETGPAADPVAGFSNWFQLQNINDMAADKKEVIFPRIDYEFWKNTAISGQGNEGVYYLTWVAGENYRDNAGVVRNFAQWTNIVTGRPRGFYFFETTNNQNPQIPGGTAFLAPSVEVNSSDDGNEWTMSGFMYLNTVSFGTQGVSGQDNRFNFPGEPYRDLGYWEVDTATNTLAESPPASGAYVLKMNGNARWDYQDTNGNGKFDLFLELRTVTRPGDNTLINVWRPVVYFNGCTVGMNGDPGADCSEPHEPYVNIVYPDDACCGAASAPNPMTFGWQDPNGTITRHPKKRITSTTWATVDGSDHCTDSTQFDVYCTSNRHDRDGYADFWFGAGDAPVLDGVFYCEGDFDPTGNARYFGSLLINGNVDSTGTNEVWFDERLIKDEWPPKEWPFPRVIITAVETD